MFDCDNCSLQSESRLQSPFIHQQFTGDLRHRILPSCAGLLLGIWMAMYRICIELKFEVAAMLCRSAMPRLKSSIMSHPCLRAYSTAALMQGIHTASPTRATERHRHNCAARPVGSAAVDTLECRCCLLLRPVRFMRRQANPASLAIS